MGEWNGSSGAAPPEPAIAPVDPPESRRRRELAGSVTLMEAWRAWAERVQERGKQVWGIDGRTNAPTPQAQLEDES